MHITSLEISNFMRISAAQVTLDPSTNAVVIGGDNGQGKSSLLQAIESAITGGRSTPDQPIKAGEEKATVKIGMTNGMIINKVFTSGGPRLEVLSAEGKKLPSPQTVLSELVGQFGFDPLAFSRMKPQEQGAEVCRVAGIDLSVIDGQIEQAYQDRRDAGRDADKAVAAADKQRAGIVGQQRVEYVDPSALMIKRCSLENENQQRAEEQHQRDQAIAEGQRLVKEVERLKKELAFAEENLTRFRASFNERHPEVTTERNDLSQIDAEIAQLGANNELAQKQQAADAAAAEAQALVAKHAEADKHLEALRKQKTDIILGAQMPVDGMSLSDDGAVTLNGVPFGQASQAQKIVIGMAIGIAASKEIKIMLIRDASLLDDATLKIVAQYAQQQGAQVWLERVGSGDQCHIVMEDGRA